jgi:hypothetical protein
MRGGLEASVRGRLLTDRPRLIHTVESSLVRRNYSTRCGGVVLVPRMVFMAQLRRT